MNNLADTLLNLLLNLVIILTNDIGNSRASLVEAAYTLGGFVTLWYHYGNQQQAGFALDKINKAEEEQRINEAEAGDLAAAPVDRLVNERISMAIQLAFSALGIVGMIFSNAAPTVEGRLINFYFSLMFMLIQYGLYYKSRHASKTWDKILASARRILKERKGNGSKNAPDVPI